MFIAQSAIERLLA